MLSPVLTMGLPLAGSATWSGTDRVAGFLEDLGDGTFRGTLAATVEDGAFHGTYAGTACALVYSGKQWLDIIGVEQPDGLVLDLTFVPMTDPEIEFDEASCPTENWLVRPAPDLSWWPDELGDPPRQPRLPEYLPFANSRWTNPSVGYSIRAATHFLPEISYVDDEDDDAAEEAGFGTSVWSIDEQLEEAVP